MKEREFDRSTDRADKQEVPTKVVREFFLEVFRSDLVWKINELPPEHREKAMHLAERFQKDILALLTQSGQARLLNTSQMLYLRMTALKSFEFRVREDKQLVSKVDFEKVLTLATYINSLETVRSPA